MDRNSPIPASDKNCLRELAKKQLEYANLPVMAERKQLWTLHNRLQGKQPMVVMEEGTFANDILPPVRCQHPLASAMERQLAQNIAAYEIFDDDKVMPDFFTVNYAINTQFLGLKQKKTYAQNGLGYHIEPLFETLEKGLPLLRPSEYTCNNKETENYEKAAADILGDLLPVVKKNDFNIWFFNPTCHIVEMMSMENMYCAMISEPDEFHALMRAVIDDLARSLRWQEENQLLALNNGNDYMGSGSYCFSDELPLADFSGKVRAKDIWGHINSQESVGISPGHFAEFIYPYYEILAKEFGLVYYGCCEPVHAYWDSLSRLPKLRKVSISAWCDEEIMGERLTSGNIIYSRKPSPNFLGIARDFDEDAFTAHIKKTAEAVKGKCKAEFIFRDVYSLRGNLDKIRRAVDITRSIAETMY
ncbi:MAG: hypothetical protein LBH43_18520 [Treponema sp.]|jgi:hypothetical protein|nr:hypothetical protein [Treponema sp.]